MLLELNGVGPTQAKSDFHDDSVVCLLRGNRRAMCLYARGVVRLRPALKGQRRRRGGAGSKVSGSIPNRSSRASRSVDWDSE